MWQDTQPELFQRYGLRYPSVCVLRRRGIAGEAAGTNEERQRMFRFEDLPSDQQNETASGAFCKRRLGVLDLGLRS